MRCPEGDLNSAGETLKYDKKVKELPANEARGSSTWGVKRIWRKSYSRN